jgi:hypothetical protein
MRRALYRFATAALLGATSVLPAAAEPSLVPLDFLPLALSDDGSVVVGTRYTGSGWEAVRYENGVTEGGFVPPSGPAPSAWVDVSADGSVLLGTDGAGFVLGRDWLLAGDTWTRLESAPGEPFRGVALSANGQVVIGHDWAVPIRFENGVATPFHPPLDPKIFDYWPHPVAASADASVVVGLGDGNDIGEPYRGAWRHESGVYETLEPGNLVHFVLALSPDGATAGGSSEDHRPLLWDDGGEIELPLRYDLGAWVSGVVDGGGFAVGTECIQMDLCLPMDIPAPEYEAVVWIDGAIFPLAEHLTAAGIDVSGRDFDHVDALSPDGRNLVGSNVFATTGWLARDVPVPEPGAPLLLAVGAALLGGARRLRGSR